MEWKEINTGNASIAEFMGMVAADHNKDYFWETSQRIVGRKVTELCYHCSYDWLMEVVEKIQETTRRETLSLAINNLFDRAGKKMLMDFNTIEDLWRVTVNYIQWYNDNIK